MNILYLIVPVVIMLAIVTVCAMLWLQGDDPLPHQEIQAEKQTPKTSNQQLIRYTYHLQPWINIAWTNTTTIRIRRAYWDADARVREYLKRKGWNWS